ncbi:MAG: tetratricopeptide repeat protein [Coriobacteriia bacterium]|nr:tetratricopeptide repeat protein [Coriobacteriia bacterium]
MNRLELLDGQLTEERKRWLVGLVTHETVIDPIDIMPVRMRYLEILSESILNDDGSLIEETLFADGYYFSELDHDPELGDVVIFGLAVASRAGGPRCMLTLGSFYYLGTFGIPQNYHEAASLYASAMELGEPQAAVNLGYCYEFGRTGVTNYEKAFHCYLRAALLANNPEGIYKVGDFYHRGRFVTRDDAMAMMLYRRSYELAEKEQNSGVCAQASFRIAEMMQNVPLPSDEALLSMLDMYMEAEVGMRREVAAGAEYYRSRMELCVKRQQEIRETIEARSRDGVSFSIYDK